LLDKKLWQHLAQDRFVVSERLT
ncbi:MAG: hypothetical protein RLZZ373_3351, partial [Pseudomonadota bacterium]